MKKRKAQLEKKTYGKKTQARFLLYLRFKIHIPFFTRNQYLCENLISL